MAIQTREDRFANLASATVTESSAAVMTYSELLTGISVGAGIGLLLDKIEYHFAHSCLQTLVLTDDQIMGGWFTSSVPTNFDFNDRRMINMMSIHPEAVIGTAASAGSFFQQPRFNAFSPPLIIASPRLFLGVLGVSLSAVATVTSRIYFRYQPLTDKEYLELAETFVLVG